MRLQLFLSGSGVCSRRKAFEYVLAGRVCVNGKKIAEPSFDVSGNEVVTLDGLAVSLKTKAYILLYKPRGVISTTKDRFASKKITDLLPPQWRHLRPVGRLDRDTTGLILLTNDGELAFRLSHPSFEAEKVYRVTLDRPLSLDDKKRIEEGVVLDGKRTSACRIDKPGAKELEITIHEGRKRQVRRMFSAFRYHVSALCRIRQGSLVLGTLKEGEWRFLNDEETRRLYKELI